MNTLHQELIKWLDIQIITSENIGDIRRMAFVPWDSAWNGLVRDETAQREVSPPSDPTEIEVSLSPVEKDLAQTKKVLGTLITWLVRDLGEESVKALLDELNKPVA